LQRKVSAPRGVQHLAEDRCSAGLQPLQGEEVEWGAAGHRGSRCRYRSGRVHPRDRASTWRPWDL